MFPAERTAPAELDTAYIFLANAQAQTGFAEAARSTQAVVSQLQGQVEARHAYRTAHGGMGLNNRPTAQPPLAYDIAALPTLAPDGSINPKATEPAPAATPPARDDVAPGDTLALFSGMEGNGELDGLDALMANLHRLRQWMRDCRPGD